MSFNLDDYIEVSERVRQFYEKHPAGRLVTELIELTPDRVTVKALAFTEVADPYPSGTGHSSLTIPGQTPYTKGSELENAETSAVGRAIAFCGFSTSKSIASRDEVQSKQTNGAQAAPAPQAEAGVPDDGDPANIEIHFGKNQGKRLSELTARQVEWYAHAWDPDGDERYPAKPVDRRLKLAAQVLAGGGGEHEMASAEADDGIPFS